jgi:GT2 family glycosyltransferase
MKNLYQIPFDQYQRYEICRRLIDQASKFQNNEKLKILDVGGFFTDDNGKPWLPAVEFLPNHEVLVIDTVDVTADHYMKSDGRNLPFPNNSYDIVISNDVFEHIAPDDRQSFINELIRVSASYVILNNPVYSAKSAVAEKIMYEYLVKVLKHEHGMLGEHLQNLVPSREETERMISGYPHSSYLSGDIDNWMNFMIIRHELYGRGVDPEIIRMMDAYCNEFHFENEMNLHEGYRSTFIIATGQDTRLIEHNFFSQIPIHRAIKIELPFASIVNLFQLKKENDALSTLDSYYPYADQLIQRFTKDSELIQTFEVKQKNFHKVGVLCATYAEQLSGKMKLTVSKLESEEIIAEKWVDLGQIEDNKWIYIDFVPIYNSNNQSYKLTIRQTTEQLGVSFYYSQDYCYGSLIVNGQKMNGSLCLKTLVREFDVSEKMDYLFYQLQNEKAKVEQEKVKVEQLRAELENTRKTTEKIKQQYDLLSVEHTYQARLFEKEKETWDLKTKALNNEITVLEEKNRNLLSLCEKGHADEAKVRELKSIIQEKDREKAEIERVLLEKIHELSLVYSTKSWKITRPLRWATQQRRKFAKGLKLLKHLTNKNGGIVKGPFVLAYKTIRTVGKEGMQGVKRRIIINQPNSFQPVHLQPLPETVDRTNYFPVSRVNDGIKLISRHTGKTDIIVCVHNALDDVKRCLYSIVQHTRHPYSVIIVDDGSQEETKLFLENISRSQGFLLIRNDQARGYTFAANQGLRASTGDYVVLLNSDTIVTSYWLDKMIMCADSDSKIGMVGPLSNTASWQSVPNIEENGDWSDNEIPDFMSLTDMSRMIDDYSARSYPRISFLNGFCMLIKRKVIKEVGYFDEDTFGRGYGEENDYCIRVRKSGWELAVADDVYVFHAQSKSYSHEKRRRLVKLADEALTSKHGHEIILEGVYDCRYNPVMEGIRARIKAALKRIELIRIAKQQWEGLKVLIVLPLLDASGGANVIFNEAESMLEMGIDVRILNLSRHKDVFEKSYKMDEFTLPLIYVDHEDQIVDISNHFDVVIATTCNSVSWIKGSSARKVYYIQDYEPYFFKEGTPQYNEAVESYRLFPDMIRITKTHWNYNEIKKQLNVDSTIVGASFNIDLFRPRNRSGLSWPQRPLRIAAMIRPSTPRRNPKGTMAVLKQVAKLHGNQVEIILFGCETQDSAFQALDLDFKWINAGILDSKQLAWLLNEIDIFLDFSHFQAMGLTAMEAMACGAAVIVPEKGGASTFVKHEHNGLIIDTSNPQNGVNAINRLIKDVELRRKIQQNAIVDICEYIPEQVVFNILKVSTAEEVRK